MLLNNHLRFTILYHRDTETDLARIVGFEASPCRFAACRAIPCPAVYSGA